jgi:hypothetical protein
MPSKKTKILYWVFTAPIVIMMAFSAFLYFQGGPQVVTGLQHLGYPAYLLKILGTAKALGVLAILYDRQRTLKEWAYAGFAIDFIGATASQAFSGDGPGLYLFPMVFLAFLLASYNLWKKLS